MYDGYWQWPTVYCLPVVVVIVGLNKNTTHDRILFTNSIQIEGLTAAAADTNTSFTIGKYSAEIYDINFIIVGVGLPVSAAAANPPHYWNVRKISIRLLSDLTESLSKFIISPEYFLRLNNNGHLSWVNLNLTEMCSTLGAGHRRMKIFKQKLDNKIKYIHKLAEQVQ